MSKFRRVIVSLAIVGMVFSVGEAFAAISYDTKVSCSLNGKQRVDSAFMDSLFEIYKLDMSSKTSSRHPAMAVLRGRPKYDRAAVWVMNPAMKCSIGGKNSGKYNVYEYAKSHAGASYSNQVGIRLYGNHCDDQRAGVYCNAYATNVSN